MQTVKETPYDGKRAKIVDENHPWYNEIATCKGAEFLVGKWALIFETEMGVRFAIFYPKTIQWVDFL